MDTFQSAGAGSRLTGRTVTGERHVKLVYSRHRGHNEDHCDNLGGIRVQVREIPEKPASE